MRKTVTLQMEKPSLISRVWYRHIGEPAPDLETRSPADWARLVPYRFRTFHQWFADLAGFFWMPCVLCDRPFGGHEAGSSIPDPFRAPSGGLMVCSQCSRRRNKGQL